jgi:hypothetical protein
LSCMTQVTFMSLYLNPCLSRRLKSQGCLSSVLEYWRSSLSPIHHVDSYVTILWQLFWAILVPYIYVINSTK